MSPTPTPFIYGDLLNKLRSTPNSMRRIIIYSAPHLGKSELMLRLFHSYPENEAVYINGFILAESKRKAQKWFDAGSEQHLFIDNFETIFNSEVRYLLLRQAEHHPKAKGRIILASRESFENLSRPLGNPSEALANEAACLLRSYWFDWLDPWHAASTQGVVSALQNAEREFNQELSRPRSGFAPRWWQEVARLCSNHPQLLKWAFEWSSLRYEQTPDAPPDFLSNYREQNALGRLKDELRVRSKPLIERNLKWLMRLQPSLHDHLPSLSLAGDLRPKVSSDEFDNLRRSGLIHREGDSWQVTAPEIFMPLIHGFAPKTVIVPSSTGEPIQVSSNAEEKLSIVPDRVHGDKEGTLHFNNEGHPKRKRLKGSAWKVIRLLDIAQGEPISIHSLTESGGFPSEHATRSAIQRLVRSLKNSGLTHLIENHHGKGYVLNPSMVSPKNPSADPSKGLV